jgi:flagellar FliL protein
MAKTAAAVAAPAEVDDAGAAGVAKGSGKRKLLLPIVAVVVLLVGGGGAALALMTDIPAKLMGGKAAAAEGANLPGSVDLPEIIANLNPGSHRTSFVKLKAKLALSSKADEAHVHEAEGQVLDLFQTYLRDMRPEELRGSAGIYRLREELIARANIAVAPAHITDILFLEMLVQ